MGEGTAEGVGEGVGPGTGVAAGGVKLGAKEATDVAGGAAGGVSGLVPKSTVASIGAVREGTWLGTDGTGADGLTTDVGGVSTCEGKT
jgi:hypothetical protein